MNNNTKRDRATNFCWKEVKLLMKIVCNYKNVIENKNTDNVSNTQKELAWQKITATFNAASGEIVRSKKSLKLKYEGIKKLTRKKGCHWQSLYETSGGSSAAPDRTVIEEKVLGICSNVTGFDSDLERYDSDNITVPESPKPSETNSDTSLEQIIEADERLIIVPGDERGMKEENLKLKNFNKTHFEVDEKDTGNADGIILCTLTTDCKNNKNDEDIINNKWTPCTPKDLKENKNFALETKIANLTKSKLELLELQKELARKELQYKKEEHELRLQLMLKEEERKQEVHDLKILIQF